ncbi:hypothetical protein ACFFMP_11260 [Pseudoroseomonas cervicalis]
MILPSPKRPEDQTSLSPLAQPGGAAEQARRAALLQVPRPSLPPRPATGR